MLEVNKELITRHHEHFKITLVHNRTPVPHETPIKEDPALVIPENPTQIKCLDEVVIPTQASEKGAKSAHEATPA